MSIHILIAEDDAEFRALICDILKKQGYLPIAVKDGEQAIDVFFSRKDISLCILDVMMPIYNGWEVLEQIREVSDVPIIMLTALSDEQYEIKGLTHGADDYIAKPFSYPIFIARVEALLRKIKQDNSQIISEGEITVNLATRQVVVHEKEIVLNNKEFLLLKLLIKNKGIVFSRDKILDIVWGYDYDGYHRTVDTHIKMLRAKLGIWGKYIVTVIGTGYKFEVNYEK